MPNNWKGRGLALLALGGVLVACAPGPSGGTGMGREAPDFSGKRSPVGSASALRVGSCSRYAAKVREVASDLFPVPLREGGLWSPLIPRESRAPGEGTLLVSKNNGENTPNLYVLVTCQQRTNVAQLEARTVGPLPLNRLQSVSQRLLALVR